MDELVRFGPWVLSAIALLLAWSASVAASGARARAAALERTLATLRPASPAAVSLTSNVVAAGEATAPPAAPRSTAFEVRLGALEERIAKLSDRVAYVARPDPDDVTPMRPPVPSTVEPSTAPLAGWRMFP